MNKDEFLDLYPGVLVFDEDERGRLLIDPDSFQSFFPDAVFAPFRDGLERSKGVHLGFILLAERPIESSPGKLT